MEIACGVDEVERPDGSAVLECVFPYLLDPCRPVADELDAVDLADTRAMLAQQIPTFSARSFF